jgi:hypothetical protein
MTASPTTPAAPACATCAHYSRSDLVTHGYCEAASSIEARARLFPGASTACWLAPVRYAPRSPAR